MLSLLKAVPGSLLKWCAKNFVQIIVRLVNMSFKKGHFPVRYKKAQVMPLLKTSGLDSSLPSNFRPISNLNTISETLERLVLIQLQPHLLNSSNFREYQSGCRTGHSTETALLEVLDGIYTATDDKQLSVIIGLDLSAHLTPFNMIYCLIDFAMSSASCQPRCPG